MKISDMLLLCFMLLTGPVWGQEPGIKIISTGTGSSFRGLSVVDDSVIWVCGNQGTVCRSTDGGKKFSCMTVPGHDSSDFRSLYAFDALSAIICKTGSPAKILRTTDGGNNWKEVYSNEHVAAFIDGIDFWDHTQGIAYGDPIDGRMLIVTTSDGGQTWNELPEENCPQLVDGEASFAASGTAIRCLENGRVFIASGGVASRLFFSHDKGNTWNWAATPVVQGKESTGIFSIDFLDDQKGIIAGGDYRNESFSTDNLFLTNDGGQSWQQPAKSTRGYRECVTYVNANKLLAVGPAGIDISLNAGHTWEPFSDEKKFHVVRKARKGKKVLLAGGDGRIGILPD